MMKKWLDKFIKPKQMTMVSHIVDLPNSVNIYRISVVACLVFVICLGGFFLWALLFPLNSAAIAEGQVKVHSSSKSIQHLEGGIVKRIFVREGDTVEPGQPLVSLNSVQSHSEELSIKKQIATKLALEARLIAERDDNNSIHFPKKLLDNKVVNPKLLIKHQLKIFNMRRSLRDENIRLLENKIVDLKEEVLSLNEQVRVADIELTHMEEERRSIVTLDKKQYIEKTALMRMNRQYADELGERQEIKSGISRVKQRIGDTKLSIIRTKGDYFSEASRQLRDIQEQLAVLNENLKAAEDVSSRKIIKAPIKGRIVNLSIHTKGGVISPGQTVMNIVPSQDRLIIEARVNPIDIDVVHSGLMAQVQFSSLKTRHMQNLDATVTNVSPDSIQDERTGQYYYLAELELDPKSLENFNYELQPGMPAQVMIITARQTPFQYFLTPIRDSFGRALRED